MEAIILMISWLYITIKMRNNSKSEHVGKWNEQTINALKTLVNWK